MKKVKNIIKKFFKKEEKKTSEKTKETCGKVPEPVEDDTTPEGRPRVVLSDEVILNDFLKKLNVIINPNSKRK